MKQRKVSLPDDLLEQLKLRSQREGISESAIIRRALILHLSATDTGTSSSGSIVAKVKS